MLSTKEAQLSHYYLCLTKYIYVDIFPKRDIS